MEMNSGHCHTGLVLLNSAGKVDKSYTPPTEDPSQPAKVPPKLLVDAASQGLFFFLRTSVARTLTRLYPVAPGNADEWLGQEILRAAADPGALGVFRFDSNCFCSKCVLNFPLLSRLCSRF